MSYFDLIPEELVVIIFSFCGFETCTYLKLVCKQFNRIVTRESLLEFHNSNINGFKFKDRILLHGKIQTSEDDKYRQNLGKLISLCNFCDHYLYYEFGKLTRVENRCPHRLFIFQTYKNGRLNGVSEIYHMNNRLHTRVYYKDDKMDGPAESYYYNGNLHYKTFYVNGKMNSSYDQYYLDGTLKLKTSYINGKLNGTYEAYHENSLRIICYFINGKIDGLYEEYYEDGTLRIKNYYINGIMI